ncbi:hypothetical protein [Pedobacter immunditicola]|uniref:hypothetical protein n=1 Tax=Pedobacter immunditicola TaxID=3133440 RepID=UPI0030A66776
MKKGFLLLLCIATLGLASCKKETIIDSGLPNETIETVINPSDWQSIEGGTRLTTTINMPELNEEAFANDGVMVYIYPDNSVNEYRQLPMTFDGQAYSYSARPGFITIDIQTSSANGTPARPAVPTGLRVVIVTSTLN